MVFAGEQLQWTPQSDLHLAAANTVSSVAVNAVNFFTHSGGIQQQRSLRRQITRARTIRMKQSLPAMKQRPIRHDALDAIHYNFPEERVRDSLTTVAEWAEAEKFCTQKLGAVFVGPTPDLPQDQVYPTRMLPGH